MNKRIWVLEIGEPLPLEENVRLHRYGQFTHFMAEQGMDVTWWTSSFSHAPKQHFVDEDCVKDYGKAKIQFIKGPGYPRNVSFARIKHNHHFAQRFLELAETYQRPDVIIAPIPTVNIAKAAVEFGKKHNIPVILDIRDLWPDELVDILPKPMRWMGRILLNGSFKAMTETCQKCDGIMGVSNDFIEYGLKFAGRKRGSQDFLFPLGYSAKSLPESDQKAGLQWFKETYGEEKIFTVCFIGTIGRFFDLSTVIAAAKKLPEVRFVLAGHGSHLDHFKKEAEGVSNVSFPGWIKGPQIFALMKNSHIGLAPYMKGANMTLPNKPFEYMAGGLPIVSSLTGDMQDLINQYDFGKSYQADQVDELVQAIQSLKNNEEDRMIKGRNSRKLLEERFATEKVFESTLNFLKNVKKSEQGKKTNVEHSL